MKTSDPAIDEVREARHRISEQFGHDPALLVDHYMKLQEEYRDRLLPGQAPSGTGKSAA